jgi:hypothetical protein
MRHFGWNKCGRAKASAMCTVFGKLAGDMIETISIGKQLPGQLITSSGTRFGADWWPSQRNGVGRAHERGIEMMEGHCGLTCSTG